jgi:hypothetical protein
VFRRREERVEKEKEGRKGSWEVVVGGGGRVER